MITHQTTPLHVEYVCLDTNSKSSWFCTHWCKSKTMKQSTTINVREFSHIFVKLLSKNTRENSLDSTHTAKQRELYDAENHKAAQRDVKDSEFAIRMLRTGYPESRATRIAREIDHIHGNVGLGDRSRRLRSSSPSSSSPSSSLSEFAIGSSKVLSTTPPAAAALTCE